MSGLELFSTVSGSQIILVVNNYLNCDKIRTSIKISVTKIGNSCKQVTVSSAECALALQVAVTSSGEDKSGLTAVVPLRVLLL